MDVVAGDGGTGGSYGGSGRGVRGREGQGYSSLLSNFTLATFTAGRGGKGGVRCGGGGGGVLMNGTGPERSANSHDNCAFGGSGFGAGGAGGKIVIIDINGHEWKLYNRGGEGADGLVYVE